MGLYSVHCADDSHHGPVALCSVMIMGLHVLSDHRLVLSHHGPVALCSVSDHGPVLSQ